MRQPDDACRGRDDGERNPVRDRDLLERAAGVVRADDADDAREFTVGLSVCGALPGVEDPRLGRRVVAGLVADPKTAGTEAALADDEPDGLAHLEGREAIPPWSG